MIGGTILSDEFNDVVIDYLIEVTIFQVLKLKMYHIQFRE